jgi:hypothetical protein
MDILGVEGVEQAQKVVDVHLARTGLHEIVTRQNLNHKLFGIKLIRHRLNRKKERKRKKEEK